MLVLHRKVNQTIVIDPTTCQVDSLGRITITVVSIDGGKVRLGIVAPRCMSVHRAEIQAAVDRQSRYVAGFKDATANAAKQPIMDQIERADGQKDEAAK